MTMPENGSEKLDHETRIISLEGELKYVKSVQEEHKEMMKQNAAKLDDLSEKISETNEHLARQNGTIPHMKEQIDEIKTYTDVLTQQQHELANQQKEVEVQGARLSAKAKTYIGIGALITAAIVGAVARELVSGLLGLLIFI